MKKIAVCFLLFLGVCFLFILSGCGDDSKSMSEIAVGNWTQFRNRAYIILITNPRGEWNSSVRMTDVTSKIVKSKGSAKGTWHIEAGQMIFTVSESDIPEVWEPNSTRFFDIVELTETSLQLKDEAGYVTKWKQTSRQAAEAANEPVTPVISMGPVAVNLNKNRSNDKDRYLCLDMNLELKELMPNQTVPAIHPRVREAVIIFLSSLVFNDVKDFDSIKAQAESLVNAINPYMEGVVDGIAIEHVVVATEIEKVEEFMIEHTLKNEPEPKDGEKGYRENGKEKKEDA